MDERQTPVGGKSTPAQVIIVTGAAGYIGSHVCEALLRRGDAVVGVDAFTPHYDPARKRANLHAIETTAALLGVAFRLIEGDIRRADVLDEAFSLARRLGDDRPPRRVLHLAARAGVRAPLAEAPDYVSTNVVATTEVLEACRRHGFGGEGDDQPVGHLVMASSSSVYGAGPAGWDGPFSEALAADRPLSPYAATKRACELLAHVYANVSGMHVTCLRFFTVVGPRARPDLTPFVFTDAVWHGRPITKFGDGTTARDYTYVGDTAAGVLAALDRFERAAAGEVEPGFRYECINLGSDRPVTLNRYLETVERLLGKPATIRQAPEQPVDPKRTWADLAKARRLLGYAPTTSFEEALGSCVKWYLREFARPESAGADPTPPFGQ